MNILLLVIVGAILEIAVWIGIAQFISGWYVFFWFIIAFFIGFKMFRSSASSLMPQLQQMQMGGQMTDSPEISKKVSYAVAGILLMIPGIITDILAVFLLIPKVQVWVRTALMQAMAKRQQAMMSKMMGGFGANMGEGNPLEDLMRQMQNQQKGQSPFQGSDIIDGEAREVKPDQKKIEHKD